jgi:hypothetical protein
MPKKAYHGRKRTSNGKKYIDIERHAFSQANEKTGEGPLNPAPDDLWEGNIQDRPVLNVTSKAEYLSMLSEHSIYDWGKNAKHEKITLLTQSILWDQYKNLKPFKKIFDSVKKCEPKLFALLEASSPEKKIDENDDCFITEDTFYITDVALDQICQ